MIAGGDAPGPDGLGEGAELRLGASGPMPPGADEHLRRVIERAMTRIPRLRLVSAEDVDVERIAAETPVVASAFAAAEEDLAEIERKAAEREARIQERLASSPHSAGASAPNDGLTGLEARIVEIVREAARLGVHFRAETGKSDSDEPPPQ